MKRLSVVLAVVVCWTLPISAQESGAKAPPLQETPEAARQGLSLTLTAAGKNDTRPARLVSLYVPAGQIVSPFLAAGPFSAKWEGNIVAALRADYTFYVTVRGAVRVTLNDKVIVESSSAASSKVTQLNKGANKLLVEYKSPESGDAMVRLDWSAKEIPTEPIPPTVFSHNANATAYREGVRVREGRLLFAQFHCTACHEGSGIVPPKGEGMPELMQDAPAISEFGGRYREKWLAHWIHDPHSIRPHSLMPRIFNGPADQIDHRAADIAAYLVSLGRPADGQPSVEHAPLGGALFANLGCIACHTTPTFSGEDEHQRVPLAHLQAKWQAPALKEYLKDPQKNYRWSRMPNFRLSDQEAEHLTSFLLAEAQREFPPSPAGDAARGAQLLVSANCLTCHAGAPPMNTPKLTETLKTGWTRGCLSPDEQGRGSAPDFRLSPLQREALQAFAAAGFESLKKDSLPEFAHRQITNLRCTACHSHDGQLSTWSQLEEEMLPLQAAAPVAEGEGMPHASTNAPLLTFAGEKLQPDWAAKFIAGGISYKPRPWIIARMPGFGTRSSLLGEGLAMDHGFAPDRDSEPAVNMEMAKNGETLLGENGGFNCTNCHAVGEKAATAVFEAPGINLAYAPERLRKGYYHRWVMNPQRIDPDTRMPRFADDDGKTPLTDLYQGNAHEQFEAIWQYLRTQLE